MKKNLIILSSIVLGLFLFVGCTQKPQEPEQSWFTLENITFDRENMKISGNCTSGYEGEMEIYIPDTLDVSKVQDGQTIQVLGGPGMTMSLPPQLMNPTQIKIVK